MCLGNIFKDFTNFDLKKYRLNRYMYNFSVDYQIIDVSDIVDIHKYLPYIFSIYKKPYLARLDLLLLIKNPNEIHYFL